MIGLIIGVFSLALIILITLLIVVFMKYTNANKKNEDLENKNIILSNEIIFLKKEKNDYKFKYQNNIQKNKDIIKIDKDK